jgi:hypothetical protein
MFATKRLATFLHDLGDEVVANTDLTVHRAAVFVVESVFNYRPEMTVVLP